MPSGTEFGFRGTGQGGVTADMPRRRVEREMTRQALLQSKAEVSHRHGDGLHRRHANGASRRNEEMAIRDARHAGLAKPMKG